MDERWAVAVAALQAERALAIAVIGEGADAAAPQDLTPEDSSHPDQGAEDLMEEVSGPTDPPTGDPSATPAETQDADDPDGNSPTLPLDLPLAKRRDGSLGGPPPLTELTGC